MQRSILLFALMLIALPGRAQYAGTGAIDRAIKNNNLTLADSLLASFTKKFLQNRNADSLVSCLFYVGRVTEKQKGADAAITAVESFLNTIKSVSTDALILRKSFIEAGEYYGSIGKNKLAYQANQQALIYTGKVPGSPPSLKGKAESNLGAYAQRMGNVDLSKQHHRRALQLYLIDPTTDFEQLHITYNSMGSIMWYGSKTDSALYFFDKALKVLAKTQQTPVNMFYRPAILYNNLSALYGIQGKTTQAIGAMKTSIMHLKKFLSGKEPDPKKVSATTFQFEATDNLAGIYKELGDYRQAKELLEYSYYQKQQMLDAKDPAIFISKILLGQLYYSLREYEKAEQYLVSGSDAIKLSDGDYLFWQADAAGTLALLYRQQKDYKKASLYFLQADSLYEASLQGDYDNIYLEFLRSASLFYAEQNMSTLAYNKARKSYNYILKNHGPQTLEAFYQLLTLSQVAYKLKQYESAKTYSIQALNTVDKIVNASSNQLDSIKAELKKPAALLLKAKAMFALMAKPGKQQLQQLLVDLNTAVEILEKRKTILNDPGNVTVLMANEGELLDFIKQVNLQLYQLSNQSAYLDNVLSVHESGIYHRIRARLDKNDSIQFYSVPAAVRNKERENKAAVGLALSGNGSHDEKMERYFAASEKWATFLKYLQQNYNAYYRLRYASIVQPAAEIQKALSESETVVRYFFSDQKLYALVISKTQKNIITLDAQHIDGLINSISVSGNTLPGTSRVLQQLYRQLWEPISSLVTTKKVKIVPDGILFYLNFELLLPQNIQHYNELATKSLLAKHTFSYHYSLLLLNDKRAHKTQDNFIAFAPGFIQNKTSAYKAGTIDPLEKDVQYLSLLPQPFTLQLINKMQQLLGGKLFTNTSSTKQQFISNAGQHSIIHIGTHAESNNDNPQFSKLIFAKSKPDDVSNELFVHEIYNCDLGADLAVLTACETGKPGFLDGEGMVSLAHAFNYAGSKSMLTGLWKIDEQSSVIIIEEFYKNLYAGLPKDEALQQAKIKFLKQSEGRMLTPVYWAGLVIMGDTSPIPLQSTFWNSGWPVALILTFMLACIIVVPYLKRKSATA